MTARDILRVVQAHGATLAWHSAERLRLTLSEAVPQTLRQTIREHREELLTLLEDFEERAAIAEYCGRLSRPEAEASAWQCVLGREHYDG